MRNSDSLQLVAVIFVFALSGCSDEPKSDEDALQATDKHAGWTTHVTKNPMDDQIQAFATSSTVGAVSGAGASIPNLKANLGVGCDAASRWAYLNFSRTISVIDTEKDRYGFDLITGRVRWDDAEPVDFKAQRKLGGDSMQFPNAFIYRMKLHQEARIEIDWYGEGRVVFRFDLIGADAAIEEAIEICGL